MKVVMPVGNKRDSPFANAEIIVPGPRLPENEVRDYSQRAISALPLLRDAGCLTTNMLASLLSCNKKQASSALKNLFFAGLARWVDVGDDGHLFRLWLPAEAKIPSPLEACRMAALSLFFTKAKIEMPGSAWFSLGTRARFTSGERAWIIEAPRRGEQPPGREGYIYIFPTLEEGREMSVEGSYFTADTLLLDGERLENSIYVK